MPIQSTEDPSKRTLTRATSGQWTASRSWMVTGATNENECLVATAIDNAPIAQLQNSHPQCAALLVDNHNITQQDAFVWNVTANYSITSDKVSQNADPSLLNQAPRILWRKSSYTIPVERDINGLPYVNSANDFIDGQTRELKVRFLRIWRYEPFFNIETSAQFEDCVNTNTFNAGPLQIQAGECLCESIEPMEEYAANAVAIPIAYDFQIRRLVVNGSRIPPFKRYIKDVGRRGYGTGNVLNEFVYNNDGSQVSNDIPLDGTGKPISSEIKVGPSKLAPISPPTPPPSRLVSALSSATVKVLGFDEYRSADFSQLTL